MRRRGVSLVDFLLYLTLAAVVMAGAVLAYNNVDNRLKRLQTAQLVNEIYAVRFRSCIAAAPPMAPGKPDLHARRCAKMIPSKGTAVCDGCR